jgi:hypothetical protein
MSQNKLLLPLGVGVGSAPLAIVAGIFESNPATAGVGLVLLEVVGGIAVAGGAGTGFLYYHASKFKRKLKREKTEMEKKKAMASKLQAQKEAKAILEKATQAFNDAKTQEAEAAKAAAEKAEAERIKVPTPKDFQKLFDDFRIEAKRILIRAYGSYGVRPKVSEILELLDSVESLNHAGLVSPENQMLISEYLQKDLRKSLKYYSNDTPGKLHKVESIDHSITNQLSVIGESLQDVISEAEKIVLLEAQKQTDFLRSKLRPITPTSNALTLRKSAN